MREGHSLRICCQLGLYADPHFWETSPRNRKMFADKWNNACKTMSACSNIYYYKYAHVPLCSNKSNKVLPVLVLLHANSELAQEKVSLLNLLAGVGNTEDFLQVRHFRWDSFTNLSRGGGGGLHPWKH